MRRAACAKRRQEGVAAIELALIMLFFMGLLPVVLLFGRALFMYTAVQKSAQDAARYMATLPLQQMTNDDTANQAAVFATQLVQQALAETGPVLKANLYPRRMHLRRVATIPAAPMPRGRCRCA